MKRGIISAFALAMLLTSCSTAYRQAQTPDDVYFSPAKEKERTYASANDNRRYDNNSRRYNRDDYEDYTSSSDDRYLRMKIQNRYRWNSLDDYSYWNSPGFAFNNYYGYNSFNPLMFNSWGLNMYSSPFASIRPFGWFNSFYPTYGYFTPYNGYFGHSYGYNYMPVFLNNTQKTSGVRRPMLGGYTNNNYNNNNNRSRNNGRYIPGFDNNNSRYNNSNNRNNGINNNNFNRSNSGINNNSNAPVRSFTPSSGGGGRSSSGGGGGVSRQPR